MPRSVKLANGRQWVGQKAAPPTGKCEHLWKKHVKKLKMWEQVFAFSKHLGLRGLAPGLLDEVASSNRCLKSINHSSTTAVQRQYNGIICHIMSAVCTSKELCFCDAADCSALPSWVRPATFQATHLGHSVPHRRLCLRRAYVVSWYILWYFMYILVCPVLSVVRCSVGIHGNT